MHSLEHLLLLLSKRIEDETGNTELAEAAKFLANESHAYDTNEFTEGEAIREMNHKWREAYPLQ